MAHEIRIPRLGWSMEVGTFLGWRKQAGETVRAGEPLFDLEGEKAAQEIEAIESGVLHIDPAAPVAGMEVPVGTLLGYLTESNEPSPYGLPGVSTANTGATIASQSSPLPAASGPVPLSTTLPPLSPAARRRARELGIEIELTHVAGSGRRGRVTRQDIDGYAASSMTSREYTSDQTAGNRRPIASPRARRVARELNVDWQALRGSGRHGRIREIDVQQAAGRRPDAEWQAPAKVPLAAPVPLTKRRRVIARRMLTSHQETAPVTLTTQVDARNLVNLREQFKATSDTIVPSYNDILIKLVASVLQRHPRMAARWDDEGIAVPGTDELAIGLAVDTDEGLLVPVLRRVPQTPLTQLAREAAVLVEDARAGRLTAEQLQGANFTVTNLGAFGIDAFTPVINLPEAAILGIGAIRREAIVGSDDQIVAGLRLTLSLTFDHRINDGAPAARFLAEIRESLENPVPRLVASC